MRTVILAYLIAVVGLVIIVVGAWGLFLLLTASMPRIPLRYYAIAIGLISGGWAWWALRRLCVCWL